MRVARPNATVWLFVFLLSACTVKQAVQSRKHAIEHTKGAEVSGGELERPIELLRTELGSTPGSLAYPYGDFDDEVVEAARSRYSIACTTRLAALGHEDDPLRRDR